MHARRSLTGALVVVSGTFIGALQQPVRDQPAARPTGSASISGIVTSDEPQPRPLRRARVMLRGADPVGSTVITNDDGTFAFEGLPAGRYAVSAAKDEYVTVNHGAPWQGGQGQPQQQAQQPTTPLPVRGPHFSLRCTGNATASTVTLSPPAQRPRASNGG